jgi:hypothetical protein
MYKRTPSSGAAATAPYQQRGIVRSQRGKVTSCSPVRSVSPWETPCSFLDVVSALQQVGPQIVKGKKVKLSCAFFNREPRN